MAKPNVLNVPKNLEGVEALEEYSKSRVNPFTSMMAREQAFVKVMSIAALEIIAEQKKTNKLLEKLVKEKNKIDFAEKE